MRNLSVFCVVASLLLCGCNPSNCAVDIYKVDINSCLAEEHWEEVNEIVRSVSLDLGGQPLSSAVLIKVYPDVILVLDQRYSRFFVLTPEGKFLDSFCRKGNGPGEYLTVSCFYYDGARQEIELWDGMKDRMMYYSPKGNFLREKQSEKSLGVSYARHNGFYYFNTGYRNVDETDRFSIFQTDSLLKVTNKYMPYSGSPSISMVPREPFLFVQDALAVLPTYSQSVFNCFPAREPEIRYSFDFGSNNMDISELLKYQSSPLEFLKKINESGAVRFLNVNETEKDIYLDYQVRDDSYVTCVKKRSGKVSTIKVAENGEMSSKYKPLTVFDNMYVSLDDSDPEETRLVFFRIK